MQQRTKEEREQYWKEYWKNARTMADGRWGSVFMTLAKPLQSAVESKGKRHCACPVHGGTDGFRFFKDFETTGAGVCNTCGTFSDGFAILQWVNGWTAREAVEEVVEHLTGKRHGGSTTPIRREIPKIAPKPEKDNTAVRASLNKTWQRALPANAKQAEPLRMYLARRGLAKPRTTALKLHPSLAYSDGEKVTGFHPAMVAVVQAPDGSPVTIHRTYLDEDGNKASVDEAKKLMAYPEGLRLSGGAIRLAPAGRVLGVAEGIETALAAMQGMGIPVWATVNATMLQQFTPPDNTELVLVFCDKDRPSKNHPRGHGQEAAMRLVERVWAQGKKAMAITPKGEIPEGAKSLDWLDILNRDGVKGFPSYEAVRRAMVGYELRKAA
ncbi:DUF7146 domain-containing protein [Simplicispira suum]|uniref:Zinc-binding protein n=1 Tax=Simplicispira suum TaxID=2109915 RepID=A0A2S0N5Q0_9BURK|nr:toprim domain-containing protein [Simplicispira suum]AVO43470.1 zinc-binding protein [Simplicispira suum]